MSETDEIVFVVDDDAPIRESLKNLIRSVGLLQVDIKPISGQATWVWANLGVGLAAWALE